MTREERVDSLIRYLRNENDGYASIREPVNYDEKQVLVYGRANSVLGSVLCADIQLEDSSELTNVDIKKALTSQLQDFKIPRRIKFVEQFELTRTGKLKRS